MIYGRTGDVVTILRNAVLADVEAMDHRKPDKTDRIAIDNLAYVVVRQDDGKERLYHQAFLRADGGFAEIERALETIRLASIEANEAASIAHAEET